MDDVGQTLLNWASAFGTQEMVQKKQLEMSSLENSHHTRCLEFETAEYANISWMVCLLMW